jgi:hypothetical protein
MRLDPRLLLAHSAVFAMLASVGCGDAVNVSPLAPTSEQGFMPVPVPAAVTVSNSAPDTSTSDSDASCQPPAPPAKLLVGSKDGRTDFDWWAEESAISYEVRVRSMAGSVVFSANSEALHTETRSISSGTYWADIRSVGCVRGPWGDAIRFTTDDGPGAGSGDGSGGGSGRVPGGESPVQG